MVKNHKNFVIVIAHISFKQKFTIKSHIQAKVSVLRDLDAKKGQINT